MATGPISLLHCCVALVPLPQIARTDSATPLALVSSADFFQQDGKQDALLTRAFDRYRGLIFSSNCSTAAVNADTESITSLSVSVRNLSAPLQLYFDESYSIAVSSSPPSARITAETR